MPSWPLPNWSSAHTLTHLLDGWNGNSRTYELGRCMDEPAMVSLGLGVADRLQLAKFCAALRVPEVLTEPQRQQEER